MQRRAFLRGGVAALAVPGTLSLPGWLDAPRPRVRHAPSAARPVRLSANENPLGIPESARRAILASLGDANRYPRNIGDLTAAIASRHHLRTENLVLGNGSTEVLQMVVQSLVRPGGALVLPDPTFEHVAEYAAPLPWRVVKVPLAADFSHDLDAMQRAAAGADPMLVYICNPNNPTGTVTSSAAVERWITTAPAAVHFLVDEAYFDFVTAPGYRTMIPLVHDHPNVVVTRTFSKIYGLAGLRLGYGVAHPRTVQRLAAFQENTNINHCAAVAALASLGDTSFLDESLRSNEKARAVAYRVLAELELEYLPSQTNFLMHRIAGNLGDYIQRMWNAGIQVGRPFPPLLSYNRVSLGTPDEMGLWAETLHDFRKRGWV